MKRLVCTLGVALLALLALPSRQVTAAPPSSETIAEYVLAQNAATGEFSTLIAALSAANLVDALNRRGQFTVFAPTDEAFAGIGVTPDNVGDLPVDTLTDILLYHVTRGKRRSQSVVGADEIRMLNGDLVFPSVDGGTAFVNDAPILDVDAVLRNGVVHVIGGVLMPPM